MWTSITLITGMIIHTEQTLRDHKCYQCRDKKIQLQILRMETRRTGWHSHSSICMFWKILSGSRIHTIMNFLSSLCASDADVHVPHLSSSSVVIGWEEECRKADEMVIAAGWSVKGTEAEPPVGWQWLLVSLLFAFLVWAWNLISNIKVDQWGLFQTANSALKHTHKEL